MGKRRGRPPHDDLLTPAEWRTVDAVRHGLANRHIASVKGVSVDAVKFHVANAIAKLGLGSRKALKYWGGSPKDSPMRDEDNNMSNELRITGLGQVSRTVRSIDEAEAWYRDVLGLAHLYTFGKLAFFDCGGARLMLSECDEVQAGESVLYLRVASIQPAYAELRERGIEFVGAPHLIHRHDDGTEEWMAFFKDLEGRHMAIMAEVAANDSPAE